MASSHGSMTGVPLMSISFPILYEFVYFNFGLYGGILIIAAVQLHVVVGGTLFRPITLKSDGVQTQEPMIIKLKKAFGRLIR